MTLCFACVDYENDLHGCIECHLTDIYACLYLYACMYGHELSTCSNAHLNSCLHMSVMIVVVAISLLLCHILGKLRVDMTLPLYVYSFEYNFFTDLT